MKKMKTSVASIVMALFILLGLCCIIPNFQLVTEANAQTGTHYSTSSTHTKYDRVSKPMSIDCTTTLSGSGSVSGGVSGGVNYGVGNVSASVSGSSSTAVTTSQVQHIQGVSISCTANSNGAFTACTDCRTSCDVNLACPLPTVFY